MFEPATQAFRPLVRPSSEPATIFTGVADAKFAVNFNHHSFRSVACGFSVTYGVYSETGDYAVLEVRSASQTVDPTSAQPFELRIPVAYSSNDPYAGATLSCSGTESNGVYRSDQRFFPVVQLPANGKLHVTADMQL